MNQFWEMYANYQALGSSDSMEESSWGKYWDAEPETYTITVKKQQKSFNKGAGYRWISQSQKNLAIKIIGVFDTVGSLGYPENVWFDVKEANKPYAFHNTEIHPRKFGCQ